jgi:hypothetical protein
MTTVPDNVYLVRHGETAWSITGQHTGRTDLALTSRGEEEARALSPLVYWAKGDRSFRNGDIVDDLGHPWRVPCDILGRLLHKALTDLAGQIHHMIQCPHLD